MKQSDYSGRNGNLFSRRRLTEELKATQVWDVIVIGGGATGLGVALDGVSRNYKVLLLEQDDFGKGTSSKSTKLVHGGVRYLAQGDIDLVREALFERGLLLKNAPHLVRNRTFIIPNYDLLRGPFYWIGLKLYDLLAGKWSLGPSQYISRAEVIKRIPTIEKSGLRNGVSYHDGQFDDARMAVNLAQTVIEKGGCALNHFPVGGLLKNKDGKIIGVQAWDKETGEKFEFTGKAVVNATGVFVNQIIEMDDQHKPPLVRPSQGAHIVLDRSFLNSEEAMMIPKTSDGRVLFAVPWHNRVIVGTTDMPVSQAELDPRPLQEEIDYILETAGRYLTRPPQHSDVLSVFAGLRPLAAHQSDDDTKTKEISRSHRIITDKSGLVTITGGKWTTFRKMGEDVIDRVVTVAQLPPRPSTSQNIKIHGALEQMPGKGETPDVYGTDRKIIKELIQEDPKLVERLHPEMDFTLAEVVLAVRNEMARTIEDVLARRVRLLFLDAAAAITCAPVVADILARELGKDEIWKNQEVERFRIFAEGYLLSKMKFPIND